MTENKIKKRKNIDKTKDTVVSKALISANWQRLLTSKLIMDEKPKDNKVDKYTGSYRRDRVKKKPSNCTEPVENKLNCLNINNDTKESTVKQLNNNDKLGNSKLTKFIALDCEMVGIGMNGRDHMLARVSIVNKFGDCIYDKYVKAREEVTDYRTSISGVTREDMLNGEEFSVVQREVAAILKGRILIGHSIRHDLSVLFLTHPKRCIRDTAKYKPFKKITNGSTPSLKVLAKEILNTQIQTGEHSSVEDARAVMMLYRCVSDQWEKQYAKKMYHYHK